MYLYKCIRGFVFLYIFSTFLCRCMISMYSSIETFTLVK